MGRRRRRRRPSYHNEQTRGKSANTVFTPYPGIMDTAATYALRVGSYFFGGDASPLGILLLYFFFPRGYIYSRPSTRTCSKPRRTFVSSRAFIIIWRLRSAAAVNVSFLKINVIPSGRIERGRTNKQPPKRKCTQFAELCRTRIEFESSSVTGTMILKTCGRGRVVVVRCRSSSSRRVQDGKFKM